MGHFTYVSNVDKTVLKQGDILLKNDDLNTIIREVHPHYLKQDYKYFIVLTQSCDLVRRDGKECKAPYISLAAVRPFDTLLSRKIAKYQKTLTEKNGRLCNKSVKHLLIQFLQKLFNNNEQEYFYLNEDDTFGFSEKMVVFLRLSIAIKANLHYDKCLHAKIMELDDNFKAKLGWMVGQMYSRVGTKDWVPEEMNNGTFQKKCEDELNKHIIWCEEKVIKEIEKGDYNVSDFSEEKIQELVESIVIKNKKVIVLERIEKIFLESDILTPEATKKIMHRIQNDSIFSAQFPK